MNKKALIIAGGCTFLLLLGFVGFQAVSFYMNAMDASSGQVAEEETVTEEDNKIIVTDEPSRLSTDQQVEAKEDETIFESPIVDDKEEVYSREEYKELDMSDFPDAQFDEFVDTEPAKRIPSLEEQREWERANGIDAEQVQQSISAEQPQ